MSHKLVDLNDDLRRLRDEGYKVDIDAGHLVVRDVPYVNAAREVRRGSLVTPLTLNGDQTIRPSDHTIKFAGEYPCASNGEPIAGIKHGSAVATISDRITVQHSFSSKPQRGHYENFYEKIKTYVAILSGPAEAIDPTVTARTYQVVEPHDDDTPFAYIDTASARAEIGMATKKLAVEKLAIVGLGGTGSYVLDLLAKTPASQIHLYDGDKFSSHNAFRAPGAASKDELHKQPMKVDYFKEMYSKMHLGVIAHDKHVDASNVEELREMACVFLCIDSGAGKKLIVDKLEEYGVPFIDVGMGLYAKEDKIGGILRVTTSESDDRATVRARISFAESERDGDYDKNIQIADLNSLNATLAVIRWKKMRRFYFDLKHERFSSYTIGGNLLLSEDIYEPQ
jgi:molybdopterin/thiamine biosynthesis adenylyltransferase